MVRAVPIARGRRCSAPGLPSGCPRPPTAANRRHILRGPAQIAIHATGVAIAGRALLILGRSHAGKSRTALALIAASTPGLPIALIGDDRILLRDGGTKEIVALPHPTIAGFIERRGLGIVAQAYIAKAEVAGVLVLADRDGDFAAIPPILQNFPCRTDVYHEDAARFVLPWWRDVCATQSRKSSPRAYRVAKD